MPGARKKNKAVETDEVKVTRKGRRKKTEIPGPEEVPVTDQEDKTQEAKEAIEPDEVLPWKHTGPSIVPYDPLQKYLAEIRKYPALSREDEHQLAVEYKEQANLKAAYRLLVSNLRLVVLIAREYQRNFRNFLDLIQEGNVGLMEALKHFDPYRGVRFPSYAVWWIRAYIIRYLMNNLRLVKIGTTQAQRKLFFNLSKEKEKLEALGFKPGPGLLAEKLDVKENEIVEMEQRLSSQDISVDAPVLGDEGTNLLNILAQEGVPIDEQLANDEFRDSMIAKIHEFKNTLKGRESEIFNDRLLKEDHLTLQEIGDRYGISRERARQIEANLLKRLRHYLSQKVKEFE